MDHRSRFGRALVFIPCPQKVRFAMVQHSIVKSKRSDAETSTGRGGLNQSILESKFKTELKPVFRKGFSTVYRMRIPDEIAECKDVQKTKCIRLKLLKPSLEGRALPQEDFAVKISKKTILVPMAISLISSFG